MVETRMDMPSLPASRSVVSVGEIDEAGDVASGQLAALIGRAMTLLESDPDAARQCLNRACLLLSSSPSGAGVSASLGAHENAKGSLARWQIDRALAYIEANLGSKLRSRELAALLTLSKSYFSRAFSRTLGVTPSTFVVNRRIEKAKLMMLSTREELTEIALACGFADQPHMTRWFRRVVGMAPGLWRRHHRAPTDFVAIDTDLVTRMRPAIERISTKRLRSVEGANRQEPGR
jgi:AraC family transcriptional regulator